MNVDVVLLPRDLSPTQAAGRAVVVFDVLRATTTMTAALAAGVKEIFVQRNIDAVRTAAQAFGDGAVLCGEHDCLPPPGFTLGNSPGGFTEDYAGRTVFMATTNGTRAIVASVAAAHLFVGALVNATAVARAIAATGADVTLLCAGTGGAMAMEDVIGAGAVLHALTALGAPVNYGSDAALMALHLFRGARATLPATLAGTRGGMNVIGAGLADDIDFAARIDCFKVVGRVDGADLRVRPV